MKKKLFSVLLCAVLLFSAVGCENKTASKTEVPAKQPSSSAASSDEAAVSDEQSSVRIERKEEWVAVSDASASTDVTSNGLSIGKSDRTIELVVEDHPGVPGFDTYYNYKIYIDGRIVNKKEYELTASVPEVRFENAQIIIPADVKEKYDSVIISAYIADEKAVRDSYVITFPRWEATLIDEFEGNKLNSDVWALRPSWPADKISRSNPNNAVVKNGILTLQGTADPWEGAPYSSCFIHTKDKFTQTYGMFTSSIEVPKVGASITAFWILPNEGDWGTTYLYGHKGYDSLIGEVDMLEYSPSWADNSYQTTTHSWREDGSRGGKGAASRYEITEGFHEYTAVWTKNGFYCYYDGILTLSQIGIEATGIPAYIILDLELGKPEDIDSTHWAGEFLLSQLPIEAKFDYVKVYKQTN